MLAFNCMKQIVHSDPINDKVFVFLTDGKARHHPERELPNLRQFFHHHRQMYKKQHRCSLFWPWW